MPLLECQNLVVQYDTPTGPRRILDGVTLAINQGQTVGIGNVLLSVGLMAWTLFRLTARQGLGWGLHKGSCDKTQ